MYATARFFYAETKCPLGFCLSFEYVHGHMQKTERIHNFFRISLLLALAIPFVLIFTPFSAPILMATFLAFGLEPIIGKVKFKTKRRKYFAVGVFLILFLVFFIPFIIFALRIANGVKSLSAETLQSSHVFQSIFDLWGKFQDYGLKLMQSFGLEQNLIPNKEELIGKVSPFIISKTTLFFSALPELGLSLIVFFCVLYVLITNATRIKKRVVSADILPPQEIDVIINSLKSNCNMILVSTILIGALQALVVSIGSLIFGFHEFFLIFSITFFLSFIPVIGAAPVALLLAAISFISGNTGDGIGLAVVTIIAGSIDNIIKPYVFSSSEDDLHPMILLLGIIGAIIVFGLPGLLLGPLVMQAIVKLGPLLIKKIATLE